MARKPFTIRLMYGSSGYTQPVTLGVDSGFTHIGASAVAEKKELYSSDVKLRTDIVKLNSERRQYRRTRRNRNTWYRKPRFLNREKPEGWLAPSIQHKLDSHIKLIEGIKKILPVSKTIVEVAAFDIQKIKNPDISGTGYQKGVQKDFWNVREYVLYRDNHTCQNCKGKSKDPVLEVHHIISRQTGGDSPDNLITLCKTCHDKVSLGKINIKAKPSKQFKAETFMTMVRWKIINELRKDGHDISHTYGYVTKGNRIELNLPKSHANDAFVIAGGDGQVRCAPYRVIQNRRNNRSLQINRKGYKPSIRKQRYPLQPGDLVKSGNMLCTVKGVFSYGKHIRLKDIYGITINTRFENVSLVKYGKGFRYAA
jgi:N6-L-threonylcarbamoyladenine synthase